MAIFPNKIMKPANSSDWELWCLKIFEKRLSATDLSRFQTSGLRQHGIDLIGHDTHGITCGIQCRLHNSKRAPSLKQLENDLKQFKDFCKNSKRFIVATTHDAVDGQKWALGATTRDCQVEYYAWPQIEDILRVDSMLRRSLVATESEYGSPTSAMFFRRSQEFSRAADRGDLTVKLWVYGNPDIRPTDPEQSGPLPGPRGAGSSWSADWRKTETMIDSPPFWFENNQRVVNSSSRFPKPWGWFDPENPNGESGFVWIHGDDRALARYRELATATWKSCIATRSNLPQVPQYIWERQKLLESPGKSLEIYWTMFLFQLAWSKQGPKSLEAPRTTWIPGVPGIRIDANISNSDALLKWLPFLDQTPDLLNAFPTSGKYFRAELCPGVLTASADVAEWLATS